MRIKTENIEQKNENYANKIEISEENRLAFVKAMKIGYYKEFHKQGLITDNQLEMLISLQDNPNAKKETA